MRNRLFVLGFIVTALASLSLSATAQAQFTYSTNGDGATLTITGYRGPGGAVEVPGNIHGRAVTVIGDFAFARHPEVTSVTMSDGVTSIGEGAFTCVDSYTSLTNVTLGNSVASIGSGAFAYCSRLMGMTIPASVTNIGDRAFIACFGLTGITVDPNNAVYSSVDGVLYNKSRTALIQYPGGRRGNFTIPDSVTNLERFALWNCQKLTGVTIPEGITEIKPEAFAACCSLTNVVMPGSVTYIGGNAFDSCVNLRGIYFHGNAPGHAQQHAFNGDVTVIYYQARTTGWGATFDGLPTATWRQ